MPNYTHLANSIQFDYAALERADRAVVQQRTIEIRDRMGRAAQNIVEIGERLLVVKETLRHGQFGAWLEAEFGWSESSAVKMMQVARTFKNVTVTDLNIGAKPGAARAGRASHRGIAPESLAAQLRLEAAHTAALKTTAACPGCGVARKRRAGWPYYPIVCLSCWKALPRPLRKLLTEETAAKYYAALAEALELLEARP